VRAACGIGCSAQLAGLHPAVANRALRGMRTYLGRVLRDIVRKTRGDAPQLRSRSEALNGRRKRTANRIFLPGRGKVRSPPIAPVRGCPMNASFGRISDLPLPGKRSLSLAGHRKPPVRKRPHLARSKGGQFIAHVKALPGNPYDGHTLETVIPEIETQPRQERAPHGPQLPQGGARRRRQRRPCRHRLQLPPAAGLARRPLARLHHRDARRRIRRRPAPTGDARASNRRIAITTAVYFTVDRSLVHAAAEKFPAAHPRQAAPKASHQRLRLGDII
jgi:hypothetical protein